MKKKNLVQAVPHIKSKSIAWSSSLKPIKGNIYLVAYHTNSTLYISICNYDGKRFVPLQSIGNIDGAVIKQDSNIQIDDYLSLHNLQELLK